MGTTLQGKTPGGADATYKWLLHLGQAGALPASPDDAVTVSLGDGTDSPIQLWAGGMRIAGNHALHTGAQTLTGDDQARVRQNIGAVGHASVEALTGADSVAAIPTVNLPVGTRISFNVDGAIHDYILDASSANTPPVSVRPSDYGATNQKAWLLRGAVVSGLRVEGSIQSDGDIYSAGGIEAAGTITADNALFTGAAITLGSGSSYGSLIAGAITPQFWTLPNATGTIALTSGPQTFAGNQAFSGTLILKDGSSSDVAIRFASESANTGWYRTGAFSIGYVAAGALRFRIKGGDAVEVFTPEFNLSADVRMFRDAANVLALRNGTTPQMFRVYRSYTSDSDYEMGFLGWSPSGTFRLGTMKAGSGTARPLELLTDNVGRIFITETGEIAVATATTVNGVLSAPNQTYATETQVATIGEVRRSHKRLGYTRRVPFAMFDAQWTANGGTTTTPATDLIVTASTGTSNNGTAMRYTSMLRPWMWAYPGSPRVGTQAGIDWGKKISIHMLIGVSVGSDAAIESTTEAWWRIGAHRESTTFGGLTNRGVAVRLSAGKLVGQVHNGSVATTGTAALYEKTTSGVWPVLHVEIRHIGGGAYQFWVNGTLKNTLTGGPTTPSQQENIQWAVMAQNGPSSTQETRAYIFTEPELTYWE